MFGLSKRATYRPIKDHCASPSGSSAAFLGAHDHVVAACARLIESKRIDHHNPKVLAGQLWSMVHGFVTLELSDHFAAFDDAVGSVLLPLDTGLAVGFGDNPARALALHDLAARRFHETQREK